jgi:hypothetical protein
VLLHKHPQVLEQDRYLHTEQARVVDPDRNPKPVEAVGFISLAEIPVVLAHAILDCG